MKKTADSCGAHCADERAGEVAPQMGAPERGGTKGREYGVTAANGLGHLLHVEEIARYKLKPRRLNGDLLRSTGEGGDLVAGEARGGDGSHTIAWLRSGSSSPQPSWPHVPAAVHSAHH